MTIIQAASKWTMSPRTVSAFARSGRIPGAHLVKNNRNRSVWEIPNDAPRPELRKRGPKLGQIYGASSTFEKMLAGGPQDDIDRIWCWQNTKTIGKIAQELKVPLSRVVELYELGCRRYLHKEG